MSEIYYQDATVTVHAGNCLDVLAELPDCSVDSVCCDPPYGLANTDPAHVAETITRWVNGERDYLPGGSGFMGKAWDAFVPPVAVWDECLRVLKPGGHVLAFAGSRTVDLMTLGLRLAGFDIRDSVAWLYGSGFPKSLDVSKAIDKAAGAEREVIGLSTEGLRSAGYEAKDRGHIKPAGQREATFDITAPATDDARTWQGWGTALKPAFESVVVARKPLAGTVAANVLAHGTGALNIDGCRVGDGADKGIWPITERRHNDAAYTLQPTETDATKGRWPANVVLDESQAAALDEQSGESVTPSKVTRGAGGQHGTYSPIGRQDDVPCYGDTGGASRFFFIAREDNEPCPSPEPANTAAPTSSQPSASAGSAPSDAATSAHHGTESQTGSPSMSGTPSASRPSAASDTAVTTTTDSESSHDWQPAKPSQMVSRARYAASLAQTDTTTTTTSHSTSDGSADHATSSTTPSSVPGVPLDGLGSRFTYVAKADASERVRVDGIAHPTVKPLALMRWLVRLVTPPGGTVLEPFAGSGTTVEACILEGFRCVAIEREADYLPLITQRIHRRRDPVEAVKALAEDRGLFDLLNEETA